MNRLLTLLQHVLGLCWNFFRLPFPGTNVSFGAILFLPMIAMISVAFFRHIFGVGGFATISKSTSAINRSRKE